MKRVKCFGKKKTTLVDNSFTRAFFDDNKPQKYGFKKKPASKLKNTSKYEHSPEKDLISPDICKSLFDSDLTEPKQLNSKSIKLKKAPPFRFKKYKGKRKQRQTGQKSLMQQKSSIFINEPSWSTFFQHQFVIENKATNQYNANDIYYEKYINLPFDSDNEILSHRKLVRRSLVNCKSPSEKVLINFGKECLPDRLEQPNNSIIVSNPATPINYLKKQVEKVPLKLKSLPNLFDKLEIHSKHCNMIKSPATPLSCLNSGTNNPMSSSFHYECLEPLKNNSYSGHNYFPMTSTPAVPTTEHHRNHKGSLNISAISANPHKEANKKCLSFEYSFSSKVSSPISASRSLKCARIQVSEKTLHPTIRSASNIERTIYLQSHSAVKEVIGDNNELISLLPKLLELCNQNEVLPFCGIYDWRKIVLKKVGEGSYGEVFTVTQNRKSFIIKVIPVSEKFSDNWQSMESVYSEIKVSHCLSNLRCGEKYRTKNFNLLKGVRVVQGCYPDELLNAWDHFIDDKTTYNIRPDVFNEEQMFIILELEYGGQDLTSFVLRNACEAEVVFKQLALSLAIAEEVHLFEHRDLHLGNILVQRNKSKSVSYIFRGKTISIPSEGLLVTIIDFTLSRILECGVIYYNDLAEDESLFNQSGDIQFEVYKATRTQLKNQWHECLLFSNVLWLNFLCRKLQDHEFSRPSSIKHVKSLHNIKMFMCNMAQCKSALDCLQACDIISIPDKIEDHTSVQNSEVVFVDRQSLLKGKTSQCF